VVEWPESCWITAWLSCSCPLCMVVYVLSVGIGAVVGAHAAPVLARGPYASLWRGESMPRGSDAPVLTLQGSSEAEIIPDGVQGSGTLMTLWGSGEVETGPKPRGLNS
jgi:hypothetical protein